MAIAKIKMTMFAVFTCVSFGTVARGTGLPKIGERVYVIKKDSSQPVSIEKDVSATKDSDVVLKDPSLTTTTRQPVRKVENKTVLKVIKPAKKSGQMSFKPVAINGNMKNPRVEFQREYLKVGIAEESYGVDFFQKVNEPLTNSDF